MNDTIENTEHETRTHSRLGGSSSHRWIECTASVALSEQVPPMPDSEASLRGIRIHKLGEDLLTEFLNYQETGEEVVTTKEMLLEQQHKSDEVDMAFDWVEHIWKGALRESITGKIYGQEDKFTLNEKLGMYGYADFWAVYIDDSGKRVGVIADLKTGMSYVDVKDNTQLIYYLLCLLYHVRTFGKDLDYCIAYIYQPMSGEDNAWRSVKYTVKQLAKWEKKIFQKAEEILVTGKTKFKVGDHCTFCPGKAVCPAFTKDMDKKIALSLADPEEVILKPVQVLGDEMIVKLITYSDLIIQYLNSCRAYAINKALSGVPIQGLKLVQGRVVSQFIKDEPQVIEFLRTLGVEPFKPKLKSMTDVKKELGKSKQALLDPIITKSTPKLSIVSASDVRPAVDAATAVFEIDDIIE